MAVKIRLARFGRKRYAFYRIVAADSRSPRDGRHLEVLGTYNPNAASDGIKELRIDSKRAKYWLSVGAQPTDRALSLLGLANIIPMKPTPPTPARVSKSSEARNFSTSSLLHGSDGTPSMVRPEHFSTYFNSLSRN